jgi:hypothetical protein
MLTLKQVLWCLLVLAITAVPLIAGSNEAKAAKENAANSTEAAAAPANASPAPNLAPSAGNANVTALLGVLVMKGVLAPAEANAIRNAAPEAEFQLLVEALSRKGVLSAADLSAATSPAAQPTGPATPPVEARESVSSSLAGPETSPQQPQTQPQAPIPSRVAGELPPPPTTVVGAVIPVRVFPIDPPKTGGLAGIKAGPITLAPYGFIKATVVHDSSDPDGDDFPFPGLFLNCAGCGFTNTGPTADPEVHIKARSTRFGVNLEWPDISKNLTITGKIEGDFEGNFSEVNNRDVSSIRSNMPQLRLAFVRLDYHASENTDIFFVGGQDWTLFGSGALENIVETTFNGAYWGNLYTRSPQLRGGFIQTLNREHHVNFEPQFGIMMPSTGQILKLGTGGLAEQLGEGEREGADSDRPEYEARVALSYQLDPAKGVAPAQIALAGFYSRRTSLISGAEVTSTLGATTCALSGYTNYCNVGFEDSSKMWGGQIVAQIPTRWFTVVATAYKGGDLRFYFGGQINSFATDISGLTNIQGLPSGFATLDGGTLTAAGPAVLGTNGAGNIVVAPEKPIQGFGGFIQLGLPLSRWFNANPKGHNAGWQLLFTLGKDQVVHHEIDNPNFLNVAASPLPLRMGKAAIGTLYYKFNNWCQFAFEQSVYGSRLDSQYPLGAPFTSYTIAGTPSNLWQDHRTEFGPIFTF